MATRGTVLLNLRIDAELGERLEKLARQTGRTKSFYVREVLAGCIDELERRYAPRHQVFQRPQTDNKHLGRKA